jgi:hypothetical protein
MRQNNLRNDVDMSSRDYDVGHKRLRSSTNANYDMGRLIDIARQLQTLAARQLRMWGV